MLTPKHTIWDESHICCEDKNFYLLPKMNFIIKLEKVFICRCLYVVAVYYRTNFNFKLTTYLKCLVELF